MKPASKNISFTNIFIVIIFILITIIRLNGITKSPPGFYKDEAGIAYNGYSILKTGKDEFGVAWPLFFRNFDDWKEPIFIYSQLPFLTIFGPDIYATRATAAFWGLATIGLLGYLVWLLTKSKYAVLLSLIFLGFMPWHFHFSRIGFQLITLPFFFCLYLIFIYTFLKTKQTKWYLWASFILGTLFYTYYAGRFYGVFFLAIQTLLFRKEVTTKTLVHSWLMFGLTLLPAFVWNASYPETITARYDAVSLFSRYKQISEVIKAYVEGYINHFSPNFWFVKGDTNVRHSPGFHYPLLWVTAPLVIAGLVKLLQNRKSPFYLLVIVSVISFPIVSALTTDAPHVHRTVQLMPVMVLVMVLGSLKLKQWFEKVVGTFLVVSWRIISKRYFLLIEFFLAIIFFTGFFLEWSLFSHYYFSTYPKKAELWFQVPDIKAIQGLLKYPTPHVIDINITEYRPSTYDLLRQIDPYKVQNGQRIAQFVAIPELKSAQKGYYLMRGNVCNTFSERFPNAIFIESPAEGFCIFRIN
ncbi:MAG: ArnT family glycosyltransferase [Patescibacteria group bacterium]|jgi:4-amino-4-deoxy-L-arabinose transferase-like glycosyltransferase